MGLIQVTIVFLLSFALIILTLPEIAFGILEVNLFFWLMIISTKKYQHYSEENLLKRFEVNSFKKQRLKIILFFYLIFMGLFIISVFLLWVYIFSFFTLDYNIFGTYIPPINFSASYFSYDAYYYFSFLEVIIIVGFSYMVNNLLKTRKQMIYGIIIILFIYMFLFGNIFYNYFWKKTIGENQYLFWIGKERIVGVTMKSIITPWASLGMWGKMIFRFSYSNTVSLLWFDISHLNENLQYNTYCNNLFWITIIWSVFYIAVPKSISYLKILLR